MPCECVYTAVLMEQQNEKLREKIKRLEKKLLEYQKELYMVYSTSESSASEQEKVPYKVIYVSRPSK